MILFTDSEGRIKAVHECEDTSLTRLDVIEDEIFPFNGWSEAKICCYRIGTIPVTETVVTGTEEITWTDEDGTEHTEIKDVTKEQLTGQVKIVMMTPYVDSRMIPKIEDMYTDIEQMKEKNESENVAHTEIEAELMYEISMMQLGMM